MWNLVRLSEMPFSIKSLPVPTPMIRPARDGPESQPLSAGADALEELACATPGLNAASSNGVIQVAAFGSPLGRVQAKDRLSIHLKHPELTLGNGGNGVNCTEVSLEAAGTAEHHPEQAGPTAAQVMLQVLPGINPR